MLPVNVLSFEVTTRPARVDKAMTEARDGTVTTRSAVPGADDV